MFKAYAFPYYWNIRLNIKAEGGTKTNIWENFDWLLSLIEPDWYLSHISAKIN